MDIDNIIIEIGKMTIPAVLTFFAGLTVGTYNEHRQLKQKSYKDQLMNLYGPLYLLIDELNLKYGAHEFSDFTIGEQQEILNILKDNSTYANSSIYFTTTEFRWALKENDEHANEIYIHLGYLVSEEFHSLRKKLRLPEINFDKAKRFND